MLSFSTDETCERCGSADSIAIFIYGLNKSYLCHECGYSAQMVYRIASLDEVNDVREALHLQPLSKLKEPQESWPGDEETIG